jgi:hypothetical protein
MPSYAHKKLVEHILLIDHPPDQPAEFLKWIEAGQHLELLVANAASDETLVYGSGPYMFMYSMVVPNNVLFPLDKADLLKWSGNPYTSIASYVYGGGRDGMWIERNNSNLYTYRYGRP